MEDKYVPMRAKLVLYILSPSSWGIEEGVHVGSHMLELLEELFSKRKAVVDVWIVNIFTVHLSSLISVSTIASVIASIPSITSITSVSAICIISSIPSITSSSLHIKHILLACLLAGSILRIVAPVPVSILIVLALLLMVPGNQIIDSIGILAIDGGDVVSGDFIITPVEAAYEIVSRIFKEIVVSIDLQVDVAELQVKMIVVSIDGEGDTRVANVDDVVVARNVEVSLLAVDKVLGVIVKYIHS